MAERQLIDSAGFRVLAAKGIKADDLAGYAIFKAAALGAKSLDPEQRIVEFVLSNAHVDREGDTIAVDGWDLNAYRRNGVVLWAHDHGGLPVAKALTTWIEGQNLLARDQFAEADLYPFADTVYRMILGKFLNAVSVGFQPTKWNIGETGVNFQAQELLEHSVCPVPAHPEALVVARAAGIDTAPLRAWAEKTLDLLARTDCGGDQACRLQRLRAQADPSGRKFFAALGELKLPKADTQIVQVHAQLNGVTVATMTASPAVDVAEQSEPLRWNRRLSKAFDVARERFEPATTELGLVSRYTDLDVKHLEQHVVRVMSARMGSYLSAANDVIASEQWQIDDVRNLTYEGKECPPLYESIQLNSRLSSDFMVDGMRFMHRREENGTEVRVALRVEPHYYGLDVTAYGVRTSGAAMRILDTIAARASELKFLKGEAFALCGEFLPRGTESWGDLFLDQKNAAAVRRIVDLVNRKGAAIENRGAILCGPPGTGKTLSARIMRNEAKATFIWVAARDFAYAGGFGGVTEAFDLARENAPSIIVFEDIDNWMSGYTVDLLKSEMDGVSQSSGVVTILTTNFPESLPAALIDRPGRFHDVLRFGLPDAAGRRAMIARWMPDLDAESVEAAVAATDGYSGAHMRELARFASIIGEQDELSLPDAVKAALVKLAEQRDLINAVQTQGSRYRAQAAIVSRLTRRGQEKSMATDIEGVQVVVRSAAGTERIVGTIAERAVPPTDPTGEETAELVRYRTLAAMLDQMAALVASGQGLVRDTMAAETRDQATDPEAEIAETAVEDAQLSSLLALCQQLMGACEGVMSAAADCLDDGAEQPDGMPAPMMALASGLASAAIFRTVAALVAKAGARHSATDMRLIQDAHDSIVALGAACQTPKAEDGKALDILTLDAEPGEDVVVVLDEEVDIGEIDADLVRELVAAQAADTMMRLTGRVDNG